MEEFSLIKRNEFNLYRPALVGAPWSKRYRHTPFFARLSTGETFMIEIGGVGQQWMGYFFAPDGELNRMVMLTPMGAKGKPGNISGVLTLFKNSSNEFGSYDNSKRLNLWDAEGKLIRSIILPLTVDSCGISTAVFNHNTLALSGIKISYDCNDNDGYPMVLIVDYQNPLEKHTSFPLCRKVYSQIKSKDKEAAGFVTSHICVLDSEKVACNLNCHHGVYLVTKDGTTISEEKIPPHFRPLAEAEKTDSTWFKYDEKGCISREGEEWLSTWTHSYPPYKYSQNRLIVPRVLYPTFYLDLYSYSDKKIKYLGYTSTDKEFLFADSSGVYLLERKDGTSVVVGQYEIVTHSYRKEQGVGWSTKRLSAEELTGIRKVPPDTSEPCPDCPREKHRPRGYCSKIDTIKLVSADSVEYLLADSLAPDKDHVILFGAPQDCPMFQAFQAAQSYVEENPGFDLTIVYTHPYPEELKEFMRLVRTQYDCLILANIDRKRPTPILKSSVCFLVVSKDGTIVSSADYPDFVPKPR